MYLEWEKDPTSRCRPILTPEGESEWKRIYGQRALITSGVGGKPSKLYLNKGSDWLTLSNGYYFSMLENQTSLPVISATIFSHTTYPGPPKGA